MQIACERLSRQGLTYVGGIEIECHGLKVTDPRNALADCTQPPSPPGVEALRHGYQNISDNVLDELEPVITPIRHALTGVGLPLRILDAEWGPVRSRYRSSRSRTWQPRTRWSCCVQRSSRSAGAWTCWHHS